ncbi:MAG: hypothetical protein FWG70_07965 [Oscillospiraceae bacterium]|nr:hypothetical protein [Oscillospiraceae bacterium]
MNNVIEFTSGNTIYSTSFVIARSIFLIILFLLVVYFLLLIFYKGRKKTITIIDKWIANIDSSSKQSSDKLYIWSEDIIYLKRYIIVYQNQDGKPLKGRIAYCWGYIYDELEIGKSYLVLKRFKTIKDVLEQMDL